MTIIFDRVARHVCTIFINRPAKRNALNLDTIKKLKLALTKFEEDDDFHVAIIGGVGGTFCAGYDVNELIEPETGMPNIQQIEQMLWPIGYKLSNKKITIAAIDGHAAGFGYELALKCDFRVGERDSRMGFMNRRFGIPIMNGGTVILPQLIGLSRAKELVATGKAQPADEALQHGLLTYISDIGCVLGRSINLARCLAKFHQPALVHDVGSTMMQYNDTRLLVAEQTKSLEYLKSCGPLKSAAKFLRGEMARHGNFDMGNLTEPDPEVTL